MDQGPERRPLPQPDTEERSSKRIVIDPRVALCHISPDALAESYSDTTLFEEMKTSLEGTPAVALRTFIDGTPHDEDSTESTVVGPPRSGKSAAINEAGAMLNLPVVDAGLVFRATAAEAQRRGYEGGEVPHDMVSVLLDSLSRATITPGNPAKGLDQKIVLPSGEYTYGELQTINKEISGPISQNQRLLDAGMELVGNQTRGKLILIGGRSVNTLFTDALARFYMARKDKDIIPEEQGKAWTMDSPYNPEMMTLYNPEGEQDLTANLLSLIIARRIEGRVSSDTSYPIPGTNVELVTGEPGKLGEIVYALDHAQDITTREADVDLPEGFTREMEAQVTSKAKNARVKLPNPHLLVESTALYVPELYHKGIPPEVIEYMSKRNPDALFTDAGDQLAAVSITYAAMIDSDGNIRTERGVTPGTLLRTPSGEGGIGWDNRFVPAVNKGTYAESGDKKLIISSRAKATRKLNLSS